MLFIFLALVVCVPHRVPPRVALVQHKSSASCQVCSSIAAYFETELFHESSSEVLLAKAEQICKQLNDPLCDQFVSTRFDALKEVLLKGYTVQEACVAVGYCDGVVHQRPKTKIARSPIVKKPKDDLTCEVCQKFVNYIEVLVLERYAKPEIEALVKQLCDQLPSILAQIYNDVIDQALDDIIAWIEEGIDDFNICVKIKLCGPTKGKAVPKVLSVRRPIPKKIPTGIFCQVGQDLVSYLEVLLANGAIEADFGHLIAEFCANLPFPIGLFCGNLVEQRIDEIIAGIEMGVPSFDLCCQIGLCSAGLRVKKVTRKPKFYLLRQGPKFVKKMPTEVLCDLCQDLVSYIEQLIIEDFVEPEIEALVADLCNSLPAPLSSLCWSYIDQYIEEIIADIEAGMSALDICWFLGLCSSQSQKRVHRIAVQTPFKVKGKKPTGAMCGICQEMIGYIEQLVLEGVVEEDIEALCNEACDLLPSPLSILCQNIIDQGIEGIIGAIEAGIDGLDICGMIGLCGDDSKKLLTKGSRIQRLMKKPTATICDYCIEAIDGVAQALANGSSKADIEQYFETLCQTLPAPLSSLCVSFVDQSLDEVIADLQAGLTDQEICGKLGLCATPPGFAKKLKEKGKLVVIRRPRMQNVARLKKLD